MISMGFPKHAIGLLRTLYSNQESAVRTACGDSEWFKIEQGVGKDAYYLLICSMLMQSEETQSPEEGQRTLFEISIYLPVVFRATHTQREIVTWCYRNHCYLSSSFTMKTFKTQLLPY